jgi:hypothetical protein
VILYNTIGWSPWTGDQPVARPLPKHRTAQTQNEDTRTHMIDTRVCVCVFVVDKALGYKPESREFETR